MSTTRRTRLAALAISLPLALGGCGLGSTLAGIHDAPAESMGGASISHAAGASVTQRVLGEAAVALEATGPGAGADREAVLVGPALDAAEARAKTREQDGAAPVTPPAEAQVLAVSRGTEWPRSILATSRQGEVQQLHVLVADGPTKPYRLFASVPMAAGATIPALGAEDSGVSVTPPGQTGSLEGVQRWARAVSYPAPKETPKGVELGDTFSTALRENAASQDKELGDLASYEVDQRVGKDAIAFELADGGTLTVAGLTRTDTITAGKKAKELTLPSDLEDVVKDGTVTERLRVTHAETVAFVQPKGGDISVVGASEQISGGSAE